VTLALDGNRLTEKSGQPSAISYQPKKRVAGAADSEGTLLADC